MIGLEIISSADLNVMTSKLVRNELKIKLNVQDLDSRKKHINSIINEVINDLSKTKDKSIKTKDIKSEPNDIKIKTEENLKNDKSIKAKDIKSEPIVTKNVKSNDSNESEDSSSDDSLDKDLSDEQLARKLHNEELGPKLRNSRSKVTKKKTKKKSKESDKPKKRGGNGYTKPCLLSPDLAEFLGQREVNHSYLTQQLINNLFLIEIVV